MPIYSLQVEKHVLSGLIKHPYIFQEISPFVSEDEFFDDVHRTIFLVIRSCFDKGEKWDKVLLAEKIKNIGISFKNDINIYDYIDNLSFVPITIPATIDAAKELVKLRVRRGLETTADDIKNFVRNNGNETLDSIISSVDSIYGSKTSLIERDNEPTSLFENAAAMIEERGNNPQDEAGLKTPYPEFNRLYGGLRSKELYAFASRPGQGKTTLVNDLCLKTCQINGVKALVCDTEMSRERIQFRQVAARSGVPMWYLETGNWRKNAEMTKKVRAALEIVSKYDFLHHLFVGGKTISQVLSIARRWHAKHVKQGERWIFGYDYLKLTGESVSKNWAEHQAIGEKVDRIKQFITELNATGVTAIQLNRTGENFNRKSEDVADDGTAVAISDRLQWFAGFLCIFRRKTLDEIAVDGEAFGTHKAIPIKTRDQGKDAAGHHDIVKRVNADGNTKHVNNFLNFQVDNWDVSERGSLRDIVDAESMKIQLDDKNPHDNNTL